MILSGDLEYGANHLSFGMLALIPMFIDEMFHLGG